MNIRYPLHSQQLLLTILALHINFLLMPLLVFDATLLTWSVSFASKHSCDMESKDANFSGHTMDMGTEKSVSSIASKSGYWSSYSACILYPKCMSLAAWWSWSLTDVDMKCNVRENFLTSIHRAVLTFWTSMVGVQTLKHIPASTLHCINITSM